MTNDSFHVLGSYPDIESCAMQGEYISAISVRAAYARSSQGPAYS